MIVAKLSTDKIVRVLKGPQPVQFDGGSWVLVCDAITDQPNKMIPYWVPATTVVWQIDFC